jgi:hypothetical protein
METLWQLPAMTRAAARATAQPKVEPAAPGRNRCRRGQLVVVIDNEARVLEGMYGLLRNWGCRVVTAATPAVGACWHGCPVVRQWAPHLGLRCIANLPGTGLILHFCAIPAARGLYDAYDRLPPNGRGHARLLSSAGLYGGGD